MKLEKMNQVSVSEFFAKSKEEMYDMAVEMVEKYNRLVDICNDTCERIATLVLERDNLSKDVQKLIGERDELIERHSVYTNALNKDIADKAAKIELLEKEIEGRKEGYVALKELMDTKYISIEEHNNICEEFKKKIVKLKKESEKWQDLAKMNRDTICNQYDVCEYFKKKIVELEEKVKHQRENLDGINKTLDIRTKENESLIKVRNNLNKEIEVHESENARLSERIIELKEEVKKRDKCIMEKNESIDTGNEAIINLRKQIGAHEEENKRLSEKIMKLHNTITELSHDIDNYKSWNASLHKDIKELKGTKYISIAEHSEIVSQFIEGYKSENEELKGTIDYYKNQERIRTNQLRAAESKVEELCDEIERLRDLGEHWKRSYFNTRYSLNKIKDESKEDDHGRKGFKEYIKYLIEEEEAKYKESWKARLNEELEAIFKEEEETEVNDIPCGEDAIE